MIRTLVCGWFTVPGGEATAGDLLVMEHVRALAAEHGPVEVATNLGFPGGVDLDDVDPSDYETLVFACGPLHGEHVADIVDRFPDAWKVAANVSVIDEALAGRFDVVIPRERGDEANPDLALGATSDDVPVIGIVRSHAQPEYRGARHDQAHDAIRLLLASRPCATVDFDTRVHPSADPVAAHGRSSAEVAALAGRVDVVVTTRLHGLVLALGCGTPALAVDPVPEGGKVSRQAAVLDWPAVHTADDLHPEHLASTLTWCLGAESLERARHIAAGADARLAPVRDRIRRALVPRSSSG